jgi:hypothetical protein
MIKSMGAGDKKNNAGGSWSAGCIAKKIQLEFLGPRKSLIFAETSKRFLL